MQSWTVYQNLLFIQNNGGNYVAKVGLTTYETLTRMDNETFPVAMIYVEAEESKMIVDNAINKLNVANPGFAHLVNSVIIGSANKTSKYF